MSRSRPRREWTDQRADRTGWGSPARTQELHAIYNAIRIIHIQRFRLTRRAIMELVGWNPGTRSVGSGPGMGAGLPKMAARFGPAEGRYTFFVRSPPLSPLAGANWVGIPPGAGCKMRTQNTARRNQPRRTATAQTSNANRPKAAARLSPVRPKLHAFYTKSTPISFGWNESGWGPSATNHEETATAQTSNGQLAPLPGRQPTEGRPARAMAISSSG